MNLHSNNPALAAIVIAASSAAAQSDPSNFDTVITIPGFAGSTISASAPIGAAGSSLQLNILPGGSIQPGASTRAGAAVEVNVLGGSVGSNFTANPGSTMNVVSGNVANGLRLLNSSVHQTGGLVDGVELVSASTFRSSGGGSFVRTTNNAERKNIFVEGGNVTFASSLLNNVHIVMTSGRVLGVVDLRAVSSFTASGGAFPARFAVSGTSVVRLFADRFFVNSVEITDRIATPEDAMVGLETSILRRDGSTLLCHFPDGNTSELTLNDGFSQQVDQFGPGAILSLVRSTGPLSCSPSDLSAPFGVLDVADVVAFLQTFGAGCP